MLVGCGLGGPGENLRDQDAPMGASTRFDTERFAGTWYEVGILGDGLRPFMKRRFTQIAPDRLEMRVELPQRLEPAPEPLERRLFDVASPGQLVPQGGKGDTLWVMWVDEGFRTAVLGTTSGRDTVILDRAPGPVPDRYQAARDVLDWYGFDISKLRKAKP